MLILGSMVLSGCSDQSAKEKAAAEETTVVDTMKQKATEAKTASSDMLDKADEYKSTAMDKADEYKATAKDKLAAGKDKLTELKEAAKDKAKEGDGGQ